VTHSTFSLQAELPLVGLDTSMSGGRQQSIAHPQDLGSVCSFFFYMIPTENSACFQQEIHTKLGGACGRAEHLVQHF
jgi:hypothetical protein